MKNFLISFIFILGINLLSSQPAMEREETPVQYDAVQIKPTFPGGIEEFMEYVMRNYQTPSDEEEDVEVGVIPISIVIGIDGKITKVEIKSVTGYAEKEIKRVLAKSPMWKPGSQNGVPVPVAFKFSITMK
jgi:protein TonB